MKMKVKDFIKEDIDIDVCDDYDERCYIAFCGALKLKPKGEEHFKEVLEYEIELFDKDFNWKYPTAIIHCEDGKQAQKAKEFFFSAAGYCSDSDYKRWFK